MRASITPSDLEHHNTSCRQRIVTKVTRRRYYTGPCRTSDTHHVPLVTCSASAP